MITWEDAQHHYVREMQIETTVCPPNVVAKNQTPTILTSVRTSASWNTQALPAGVQKGTAIVWNSRGVHCTVKYIFNTQLSHPVPKYVPRQMKIYVHIKTYLLTFIEAFFIIAKKNPTKLATTQVSINGWVNMQIMVYLHHEMLLNNKKAYYWMILKASC